MRDSAINHSLNLKRIHVERLINSDLWVEASLFQFQKTNLLRLTHQDHLIQTLRSKQLNLLKIHFHMQLKFNLQFVMVSLHSAKVLTKLLTKKDL